MKGRTYISGEISAISHNEARKRFGCAACKIQMLGGMPISPFDNGLSCDTKYDQHLLRDIRILITCENVYFLDGWINSMKARIEHAIAIEYQLNCIYEYVENIGDIIEFAKVRAAQINDIDPYELANSRHVPAMLSRMMLYAALIEFYHEGIYTRLAEHLPRSRSSIFQCRQKHDNEYATNATYRARFLSLKFYISYFFK